MIGPMKLRGIKLKIKVVSNLIFHQVYARPKQPEATSPSTVWQDWHIALIYLYFDCLPFFQLFIARYITTCRRVYSIEIMGD